MKTYRRKAMYRLTYSRAVVTMGQLQARRIAEGIEERFGAYDIDADLIEAAILKDCDLLSQVTEELAAATTAVSRELARDLLARAGRDEQASRDRRHLRPYLRYRHPGGRARARGRAL